MKNYLISIAIIIFMLSCKKESMDKVEIPSVTLSNGITLKKANKPINELLKNPNDIENETISFHLYSITKDLKQLYNDKNFKTFFISFIKNEKKQILNYLIY